MNPSDAYRRNLAAMPQAEQDARAYFESCITDKMARPNRDTVAVFQVLCFKVPGVFVSLIYHGPDYAGTEGHGDYELLAEGHTGREARFGSLDNAVAAGLGAIDVLTRPEDSQLSFLRRRWQEAQAHADTEAGLCAVFAESLHRSAADVARAVKP